MSRCTLSLQAHREVQALFPPPCAPRKATSPTATQTLQHSPEQCRAAPRFNPSAPARAQQCQLPCVGLPCPWPWMNPLHIPTITLGMFILGTHAENTVMSHIPIPQHSRRSGCPHCCHPYTMPCRCLLPPPCPQGCQLAATCLLVCCHGDGDMVTDEGWSLSPLRECCLHNRVGLPCIGTPRDKRLFP